MDIDIDSTCDDPLNPGVGCDEAEMVNQDIKIDGIDGESTDDRHNDWIEIRSFLKSGKSDIEWEYTPIDDNGRSGIALIDQNGDWIEILSVQSKGESAGKIKGTQKKSIFGIFDVEMEVEADVDAKGKLSNVKKPWYAFLAW